VCFTTSSLSSGHLLSGFAVVAPVDLENALFSHSQKYVFQHKLANHNIVLVQVGEHFVHSHFLVTLQNVVGTLLHGPTASGHLVRLALELSAKLAVGFALGFEGAFAHGLLLVEVGWTAFSGELVVFVVLFGGFDNFPLLEGFEGLLEHKLGDLNVGAQQ